MPFKIEYEIIVKLSTNVVGKYSKNWNKVMIITSYCHTSYNGFGLSYQDAESNKLSYWGETYSDISPEEMYSFDGYDYINETLSEYYNYCKNDDKLRWNRGFITIYPSGEYESEFIWDNEAHLEKLVFKAENLFSLLYYEISSCPAFYNAREEQISWQEATVIILFKSGKVQPLNVEVKTATNEIIHYSEAIEEEFGESEYQSSRQYYEETYHLMNEGELKALYQRWNVATIHIKYGVRFDFEKHVILEWKEENA